MFDTFNADACAHERQDFDSGFGIADTDTKTRDAISVRGDYESLRKRYADVRPYAFSPIFRIR